VAGYIANAMSRGDVVDGEEYQFLRDTKHARFIFDKEVDDYINEIFRKSIDLQFFSRQIKQLQGKPLEEVSEKRRKVFEWLQNELKNLQKRFEKFLQL
jgi:predicted  nucleic acid-binding Zn-ribbon protein